MKTTYICNLKLDEIKISNFLDLILNYNNLSFHLNPFEYSTNIFLPLLKKIDQSSTVNKITFLPIEFLRLLFPQEKYNFRSELEEKEYLFCKIPKSEYKNILKQTFKNVKLKLLKKPLITSLVNDCINYKLLNNFDEFENDVENIHESHLKKNKSIAELYYMNIKSINEIIERLNLLYDYTNIYVLNTIYLMDKNDFVMIINNNLKNIINSLPNINVFIIPILYNNHFTVVGLNVKFKHVYFYDSFGYNPKYIFKNSNYNHYFLSPSLKFKKNNTNVHPQRSYKYTDTLISEFEKITKVKKILYNNFKQQKSCAECGPFIITFILSFLHVNPKTKLDIKFVYNSNVFKGDLTVNYLKSSMFTIIDDLTEEEANNYLTDLKIYKNNNLHFETYLKEYSKNIRELYFNIIGTVKTLHNV